MANSRNSHDSDDETVDPELVHQLVQQADTISTCIHRIRLDRHRLAKFHAALLGLLVADADRENDIIAEAIERVLELGVLPEADRTCITRLMDRLGTTPSQEAISLLTAEIFQEGDASIPTFALPRDLSNVDPDGVFAERQAALEELSSDLRSTQRAIAAAAVSIAAAIQLIENGQGVHTVMQTVQFAHRSTSPESSMQPILCRLDAVREAGSARHFFELTREQPE